MKKLIPFEEYASNCDGIIRDVKIRITNENGRRYEIWRNEIPINFIKPNEIIYLNKLRDEELGIELELKYLILDSRIETDGHYVDMEVVNINSYYELFNFFEDSSIDLDLDGRERLVCVSKFTLVILSEVDNSEILFVVPPTMFIEAMINNDIRKNYDICVQRNFENKFEHIYEM